MANRFFLIKDIWKLTFIAEYLCNSLNLKANCFWLETSERGRCSKVCNCTNFYSYRIL